MTHVHLTGHSDGRSTLTVDGMDLSNAVLADGFKIELPPQAGPARVTMVIAADTLDVDLPDAVIRSLRAEDEDAD